MISGYKFYRIYSTVHLHFHTSFDFFKYAGRSNAVTKENYQNHAAWNRFEYWSTSIDTEEHAMQICVFNSVISDSWLYGTFDTAKDKYLTKKKYFSNFATNIKEDHEYIKWLQSSKNLSFEEITRPTKSGNAPPILQLYLQNYISVEYICLVNYAHSFIDHWKDSIDPLVKIEATRIMKYQPWVLKYRNG